MRSFCFGLDNAICCNGFPVDIGENRGKRRASTGMIEEYSTAAQERLIVGRELFREVSLQTCEQLTLPSYPLDKGV